jgi:anti-anti-sigma regulatory factor
MLGTSEHYTSAQFYGYHDTDHIVIVGHAEPAHVGRMQQELVDLTSELAETHRQIRRQNQALQKALDEQHQLLDTIQQLTMPAVPIWERVLLLPLVGYIDSQRAERITSQLLARVGTARAHYVILDVSAIADIDTAVARHLIGTAQALRLLGARPVLVGISPELAETVTTLGIGLHEFVVQSDLQHAVAYVLRRLRKG